MKRIFYAFTSSRLTILFIVLIVIVIAVAPASACVCAGTFEGYPACQAFWDTDVIFTGRTAGTPLPPNTQIMPTAAVRFTVEKSFKGVKDSEIVLVQDGSSCDYGFEPGKEYLVYAMRDPATGLIKNRTCGRTMPLERAGEDLAYFKLVESGAQLPLFYGSVLHGIIQQPGDYLRFVGLPEIKVQITDDTGATREISTDADGRFQLFDLKNDNYTVSPQLPNEFASGGMNIPRKIKINAPRCTGAVFVIDPRPKQ